MALPVSSLSQVCRSIADFVGDGLDAQENAIRVMIGNPAEAAPKDTDNEHRVNLFFYRFEPFDFQADGGADQTWWLRLHCLITAFGILDDQVSPGENDLRLLGELMRLFQETPVLDVGEINQEPVALQVIFQPLSMDDINHLWSTQGDVSYRTSIAYEMAVAPVVPSKPGIGGPLAGAFGYEVHADMDTRYASFSGLVQTPPVQRISVDYRPKAWAPHICLVYQGQCAYTLAFELGSPELEAFRPDVWIAGEPGTEVALRWDKWKPNIGWQTRKRAWQTTINTDTLDPDAAADAQTIRVWLARRPGQAVLYASREYLDEASGRLLTVRSNPILVTVYEATP